MRRSVALPALLVALLLAGCSRLPFQVVRAYPAVGLPPDHVVGPRGDTLWTRRVGPVTLVSPDRAPFDSAYVVLETAPKVYARLFGGEPPAVTAVLLRAPGKRGRPPRRPALPDTMTAARPVVWGVYVTEDTLPEAMDIPETSQSRRMRRSNYPHPMLPDSVTPVTDYGVVFPVEFHVAQQWLDMEMAARGRLPVWLQAALVTTIAEGADRITPWPLDRGLRDAPPIDTLVGRDCGPTWKPVPGASGLRFGYARPTAGKERAAWAPWLRDACGYRLRVHAHAVLRFLVETAGWQIVPLLVEDARAGHPIETTLARFPTVLPGTRAQLEEVFKQWVLEREAVPLRHDPRMRLAEGQGAG